MASFSIWFYKIGWKLLQWCKLLIHNCLKNIPLLFSSSFNTKIRYCVFSFYWILFGSIFSVQWQKEAPVSSYCSENHLISTCKNANLGNNHIPKNRWFILSESCQNNISFNNQTFPTLKFKTLTKLQEKMTVVLHFFFWRELQKISFLKNNNQSPENNNAVVTMIKQWKIFSTLRLFHSSSSSRNAILKANRR